MSFRGRGRGRGRGRFASFEFRRAKHEPFILFPDTKLPPVPNLDELSKEEKMLISSKIKFDNFWKSSPYYLGDEKEQDEEDEQSADKLKRKGQQQQQQHNFGPYMKLNTFYFPAELIEGEKKVPVETKKLRWETQGDDMNLLKKLQEEEDKDNEKANSVKEKKDEDDEDEDKDEGLEKEESESSDDYNQFEAFDDDEDDYNMDDGPDEDYYE